jgi:hypothetical protein
VLPGALANDFEQPSLSAGTMNGGGSSCVRSRPHRTSRA